MTNLSDGSSDAHDGVIPVPPDAVRVWRGFRLATVAQGSFFSELGAIFIPVTVQMQRLFGLTAYLPAVMPADKAASVPDEIALVFYRSQQAYQDAKTCVGGRAYSLLHATIFDLAVSLSDFPKLLDGNFRLDAPFHLFADTVDWQGGFTQVFVGARRSATEPAAFAKSVATFCAALQSQRPPGLDGAVVVAAPPYLIFWEHWGARAQAQSSRIAELAAVAAPVLLAPYSSAAVEPALDKPYAGLAVSGGECFNTQFPRPGSRG